MKTKDPIILDKFEDNPDADYYALKAQGYVYDRGFWILYEQLPSQRNPKVLESDPAKLL
jgi:hypothetical protein